MVSKNIMILSVISFALLLLINAGDALDPGANCTMPDGSAGVCTVLKSCQAAKAAQAKGVRPTLCCIKKKITYVCCRNDVPASYVPGKSKKMCEQYADAVFVHEDSPLLIGEPEVIRVSHCGRNSEMLIAGGEGAGEKEFPHMVALGYSDGSETQWRCGGSLISDRYVLTAAHCLGGQGGLVKWALLGVTNYSGLVFDDQDMPGFHDENMPGSHGHALRMEIVERIPHPNYRDTPHYDIALLKLESKIQLNPHVRPACLNTNLVTARDYVIATGWGTQGIDADLSSVLMKVALQVKVASKCKSAFKHLKNVIAGKVFEENIMICAGDAASVGQTDSFKDTCQGDSGGPIQLALETPFCMYSIVGVTSHGLEGCGLSPQPAIYTRVSHFVPWIESIVWPN